LYFPISGFIVPGMRHWTNRVRPPTMPPELQDARQAAEELGRYAGRAPGRARVIFQTVSDIALLATISVSGALAAVHLWRALNHHADRYNRQPESQPQESGNDRPPHHRIRIAADTSRGRE
jgi:hypothetical protein